MNLFPQIYRRGDPICHVYDIEPLLASWDHKNHPSQIRLRSYLNDLRSKVGKLPTDRALFLELHVDVRDPQRLTKHYDVENYLTPVLGTTWFDHRQFPLVHGTKCVGGGSRLTLGEVHIEPSEILGTSWQYLATNAGKSPTLKSWKERLNEYVASSGVEVIPDGKTIEFHMAWRCSTRRNWVWLWKPTGDALSPILGYSGDNRFNPNDDRITSLTFHRFDDNSLGNDIYVGLWWRVAQQNAEQSGEPELPFTRV
jgi:hypothetical protein